MGNGSRGNGAKNRNDFWSCRLIGPLYHAVKRQPVLSTLAPWLLSDNLLVRRPTFHFLPSCTCSFAPPPLPPARLSPSEPCTSGSHPADSPPASPRSVTPTFDPLPHPRQPVCLTTLPEASHLPSRYGGPDCWRVGEIGKSSPRCGDRDRTGTC